MSQFILVEFDDDDKAETFRAKLKDKVGIRLAGVYQIPRSWCTCPFQIKGENRPVSRGKRFGWWVCGWCKKPRPGTHQVRNLVSEFVMGPLNKRRYDYRADNISIYETPNPLFEEQ